VQHVDALMHVYFTQKKLGHTHIDVLKLDVEGSEYHFLEEVFDTMGCPPVNVIAAEFHHHTIDPRYGGGSAPVIGNIATMLEACGYVHYRNPRACSTSSFTAFSTILVFLLAITLRSIFFLIGWTCIS
jgi:hypothetical protein